LSGCAASSGLAEIDNAATMNRAFHMAASFGQEGARCCPIV
jgi:hypothetical protein